MRLLSRSIWFSVPVLLLLSLNARADEFSDDEVVEDVLVEDESVVTETPKEEYSAPQFQTPTIDRRSAHFVEWFDDLGSIGKKWFKSTAKKEGTEEVLSKYNGEWIIGTSSNVVIEGDYGLIVKSKARHHAIKASLNKLYEFDGKPLVVQYEVKYEEGQECGGGYLKLLSSDSSEKVDVFHDKTPYTIMFGPDKCGMSSKVHFILKLKNPKNGTISEYNAKQPSRSLAPFFDDKKTHLYTLIVKPDNRFQVLVDNAEIMSGSMLTDLEPSIVPPKQIADPEAHELYGGDNRKEPAFVSTYEHVLDKKPADWDERETIEDKEAKKPDDWDEDAPKEVLDIDAQKPSDWLEEEEGLIPDPQAVKPEDWDDELDSEWEPKKISNPKCEGVSGCGKWTQPMKPNPEYKGKWTAPKIPNPAYKGKWSARLIDNPHYFEADPYKQFASIGAIGFELWTMSANIVFDNIVITDDVDVAREFARQTFNLKVDQEKLFDQIANPSQMQSLWASVKSATEERPWLWAVFVLVLLIPVILISVFCFGKKSPSTASHPKKTDALEADDVADEEMEEVENEMEEEEDVRSPSTSASTRAQVRKSASKESNPGNPQASKRGSQSEEEKEEEQAQPLKEPPSPSTTTARKTRVRRVD